MIRYKSDRLPDRSSVEDWLILLKLLESLLRHPELGFVPMFPSASFWDLKTQGLKIKVVIHVDKHAHIFCDTAVSRSHGLTKGILHGKKQTQGKECFGGNTSQTLHSWAWWGVIHMWTCKHPYYSHLQWGFSFFFSQYCAPVLELIHFIYLPI